MDMNERVARLLEPYAAGERVRAVETLIYGTGEEVAEGTLGRVQRVNVHGCSPLVTVAWEGRGGEGQPDHILHPCSAESLEPVDRGRNHLHVNEHRRKSEGITVSRPVICPICGVDLTTTPHKPPCLNTR